MDTNLELIEKWVGCLRSGKYTQGRKALRDTENKFCCLGVLCDITKEELNLEWKLLPDELTYYMGKEDCVGVLPFKVSYYLGEELDYTVMIKANNSKILEYINNDLKWDYIYLTELNDVWGLNFNQIADILEEEFLR